MQSQIAAGTHGVTPLQHMLHVCILLATHQSVTQVCQVHLQAKLTGHPNHVDDTADAAEAWHNLRCCCWPQQDPDWGDPGTSKPSPTPVHRAADSAGHML